MSGCKQLSEPGQSPPPSPVNMSYKTSFARPQTVSASSEKSVLSTRFGVIEKRKMVPKTIQKYFLLTISFIN